LTYSVIPFASHLAQVTLIIAGLMIERELDRLSSRANRSGAFASAGSLGKVPPEFIVRNNGKDRREKRHRHKKPDESKQHGTHQSA